MNPPPYGSLQGRPEEWSQVWKSLSRMQGLKTLHVQLYQTFDSEWMDMPDGHLFSWDRTWRKLSESDMESTIAPIRQVTIPDHFVLDFGFGSDAHRLAWDTLPCRVISP